MTILKTTAVIFATANLVLFILPSLFKIDACSTYLLSNIDKTATAILFSTTHFNKIRPRSATDQ